MWTLLFAKTKNQTSAFMWKKLGLGGLRPSLVKK